MADDRFKLPRSSYDELTKIIKAYGQLAAAGSLDDVSKTVGINTTVISGNVRFLTGVGILETGKKKQTTAAGRQLARALEHGIPDQTRAAWGGVIRESDFLSRVLAAVRIRGGMEARTLEAHIAYSAGERNSPEVRTGARTVLEILRAAGLVSESDGTVTLVDGPPAEPPESSPEQADGRDPLAVTVWDDSTPTVASRKGPLAVHAQVRIEVQIQCGPGDLDGLGARLRRLLDDVAGGDATAGEHEPVGEA